MGIAILSVLSVIALCCIFIAYKQFQTPNKQTKQNNWSEENKTNETENFTTEKNEGPLFCKPDIQVFIESIVYDKGIVKIKKIIPEEYKDRDNVSDLNLPLTSIKIWWIMDDKPNISLAFDFSGMFPPFYGKMSLFLSVDGKIYELTHKEYKTMQGFVKKFEEELEKMVK